MSVLFQPIAGYNFLFLVFALGTIPGVNAQEISSVTGKLIDEKSLQVVQYAYVTLTGTTDSTKLFTAIVNENGVFKISPVPAGKYRLSTSFPGYRPASEIIDIMNNSITDAGTMYLKEEAIALKETIVVGEQLKAKSERDKTTYFITKKITDATDTGSDLLKLIPGIQIDLMENISLEGSQKIRIFVDGKERDRSFINQLSPKQIEKVEIITSPPSNYDSNITGAINVILKKEHDSGFSGQIYSEIPTTGSEIFMFPTCSLNYGFKKWNLFTSYQGEMTYLNIHDQTIRQVLNNQGNIVTNLNQYLRQKDWSHKFQYGFDYLVTPHDQFNFYAFYNPYSRELDGNAYSQTSGSIYSRWQAKKEDQDINSTTSWSVYYKHNFAKQGEEITLDLTNYNLRAENSTEYTSQESENNKVNLINCLKPKEQVQYVKLDYSTFFTKNLNLNAGIKGRFQALQNRAVHDFSYHENIFAVYSTVGYKRNSFDLSLGLRTEKSFSDLKNSFSKDVLSVLPYATGRYKISDGQNINLSYNQTLTRPNLYQLIPSISIDDPNALTKGNSKLNPELRKAISLEHSVRFKSNYFANRLFYSMITNVINNLTFVNDTGAFETQVQNLGTIIKFGVQFSGSCKVGIATLNPYLQIYKQTTRGNTLAQQYGVQNRKQIGFDSGLSAILSFKNDFSFSLIFQYATPKNNIQDNSFCDALYFLSIEKAIHKKFKIGLVSGIPFTKSFVYRGSEIHGENFAAQSRGVVNMSVIPIWFKISYQFNSDKKREKIDRIREEIDTLPKKGF